MIQRNRNQQAGNGQISGPVRPNKNFPTKMPSVPGRIPGVRNLQQNAQGVAYDTTGNSMAITKTAGGSLIGRKLTFSITAGTTYAGGVIPFIPQTGAETLPTGITFTGGNFTNYADFALFLYNSKLRLSHLLVTTDQNSNFLLQIKVTERDSFGGTKPWYETWDSLAKNFAAQDQSGREIEDIGWVSGDPYFKTEFFMQIPASGTYTMSFTFVVDGTGGTVREMAPAKS